MFFFVVFFKKNDLLPFLLQELLLIYCNNMITRAVLKNKGLIFIYFFPFFCLIFCGMILALCVFVEEAGMVGSPMVAEEVDVAATGVERDGEAEKGLWELSVFTLLGVGS